MQRVSYDEQVRAQRVWFPTINILTVIKELPTLRLLWWNMGPPGVRVLFLRRFEGELKRIS